MLTPYDQAKSLIDRFAAQYGCEIELTEEGDCGVLLDDQTQLTLRVESEQNGLFFYAELAQLPDSGADALLREILESNYLWSDTNGATLAIVDHGTLISQQLIPLADLDAEALAELFAAVTQRARYWKARTEGSPMDGAMDNQYGHRAEATARSAGASPDSGLTMIGV